MKKTRQPTTAQGADRQFRRGLDAAIWQRILKIDPERPRLADGRDVDPQFNTPAFGSREAADS